MEFNITLPDSPEFQEALRIKLKAEADKAIFEAKRAEVEFIEYKAQVDYGRASNFRNRVYDFVGAVERSSVEEALDVINRWARQNNDPITIRFTSPGGHVTEGFSLFDNIRMHISDGVPVKVIAVGEAGSMAAVLLQAGSDRLISQNAQFFIHEMGTQVKEAKIDIGEWEQKARDMRKLNDRLIDVLAERSTLTSREIATKIRGKGWTLDAETCLKYGFADAILNTSYKVK